MTTNSDHELLLSARMLSAGDQSIIFPILIGFMSELSELSELNPLGLFLMPPRS